MQHVNVGPQRRQWLLAAAAGLVLPTSARAQATAPRIVSIGGALTETLHALGAMADVVGVDTTSTFPAAVQNLPSVGYARALSAEGVLSLRPTLVVASGEAGPPAVLRQLQAAGIRLELLDADHRFEGVLARTQRLADVCGRSAAGAALVADLQARWRATRALVEQRAQTQTQTQTPRVAPSVLFVLSHSMASLRVSGSGTAADAMLVYAGARNALRGVEGYKPLTPEAAIAAAPDIILATEQGLLAAGGVAGLLNAPGLAMTPAGRAGRVVALDALWLLGFGPRLPQAVTALAEALHARVG